MQQNHLKLNDTKTEFLVIGSNHLIKKLSNVSSIAIEDSEVEAVDNARNIGSVIDSKLSALYGATCRLDMQNLLSSHSQYQQDT